MIGKKIVFDRINGGQKVEIKREKKKKKKKEQHVSGSSESELVVDAKGEN
jgi:hypothetical protein